jgi:hypothetical protein
MPRDTQGKTTNHKDFPIGVDWPFRVAGDGIEQFNRRFGVWAPLKGCKDGTGYMMASWKAPKQPRKFMRVHRVVWVCHNGPIPDGQEIDHIDMDKSNNNINNLRLVTHRQNIQAARTLLGNWSPGKLKPHQIALLLALPEGSRCLHALAHRWCVSKFYLGNLRTKAKKEKDPRFLAGLT